MTEDVIHMATTFDRMRQEADLYESEIAAAMQRRLIRLRGFLDTEIYNMLQRCEASDPTTTYRNLKERAAPWLHGKTHEKTYRDWSKPSKVARTEALLKELLRLCGGDKVLLLSEYTRALDRLFPIPGKAFKWAPQLVKSESGRLTVIHKWALIKKEVSDDEEG